jgi:hypothetical protein
MNDVFNRKETFFERLQSFVEQKIHHSEQLGDKITGLDLINLYELHSRDQNPKHKFSGRMDTQEWSDRTKIFGRMAELMNQTYGNEPDKEQANFTLAKMIYLMGHGMIASSNPERSCTFIEVANRYGIEAVKDMASKNMTDGADVKFAYEKYPTTAQVHTSASAAKEPEAGFAAKFAQDAAMNNTDKINAQRAAANEGAFVQSV